MFLTSEGREFHSLGAEQPKVLLPMVLTWKEATANWIAEEDRSERGIVTLTQSKLASSTGEKLQQR